LASQTFKATLPQPFVFDRRSPLITTAKVDSPAWKSSTRKNAFNMHPPTVVYLLLFALACGCALIAGFSMTGSRRSWLHMIAFAAIVSITIYAILDIEYPRRGFVKLTDRDQVFLDLRDSMK